MKNYKPSKFPVSDHCNGHSFFNPSGTAPKSLYDVLKWKLNNHQKRWPKFITNTAQPELAATTNDHEIVLTFINHVTFLIQTAGMNILTDPVFSERVSPFQWIGPRRIRSPGLSFDQLPKIDIVCVSHNHYDHMDLPTIARLARTFQPQFVTPLGNGTILKKAGALHILETDWWQSLDFQALKITTVPAQHWSGRGLKDRNLALWAGFVIQTQEKKIYFAGDTGYGPHFRQIHEQIGEIDLALLPIGAYEPRWFMREQHMNPEDAVLAHSDLKARHGVGMHFGTFQLTDEELDDPVTELELALKKHNITDFHVLEVGQTQRF